MLQKLQSFRRHCPCFLSGNIGYMYNVRRAIFFSNLCNIVARVNSVFLVDVNHVFHVK